MSMKESAFGLKEHFGHKIEIMMKDGQPVIVCTNCRRILKENVCPKGGCVSKYKQPEELWCPSASLESKLAIVSKETGMTFITIRCRKLNKGVVAAIE